MTRRFFKTLVVMMLLACMMVNMYTLTMAASYIKDINIVVEDNGEAYPDIYVNDGKCYLSEDISWNKEEDKLRVGSEVRGMLTLVPDSGYRFKKDAKIEVNITGSGKKFASSTYLITSTEECKILVSYKVDGTPEVPEEAFWAESTPWVAKASKVTGATGYEFTFYRGGTILKVVTVVSPNVDFSEELTEYETCENDYVYFEVRTTRGKNKSGYVQSDYFSKWRELKDWCDKVSNRTWKWKDSKKTQTNTPRVESVNQGSLVPPPYPGA